MEPVKTWLRIGSSPVQSCRHGTGTFGFSRKRGISWPSELLSASQEVLCSMQFIKYYPQHFAWEWEPSSRRTGRCPGISVQFEGAVLSCPAWCGSSRHASQPLLLPASRRHYAVITHTQCFARLLPVLWIHFRVFTCACKKFTQPSYLWIIDGTKLQSTKIGWPVQAQCL
jgi:hypothetical protein